MDKGADWKSFCELIRAADEVTAGKARTREGLTLMFEALKLYSLAQVSEAISGHIKKSPYAVKPADVIRYLDGSPEELASLAWREFINALDRYAYYDSVRFPHPAYHYAVQQYGGWQSISREWHDLTSKELEFRAPEFKRLFEVGLRKASWDGDSGTVRVPAYLVGYYESHNRSIGGKNIPDVIEIATGERISRKALTGGEEENIIQLPQFKTGTEDNA